MKFGISSLLVAFTAPAVLGDVAGVLTGDIVASESLSQGEGGVERIYPGKITCHATDSRREKAAGLTPLWTKAVMELKELADPEYFNGRAVTKMCTVYKHHAGCVRHVCKDNAAIFVCANNIQESIPIFCSDVAFLVEVLMHKCKAGDTVIGSIEDSKNRFTVEINASDCKRETRTTYFYGECHGYKCTPSEHGTNGVQRWKDSKFDWP